MHWILILTIVAPSVGGVSVTEVGPFVNKNNCTKAANAWVKDVKKRENKFSNIRLSAICVQK